MLRSLIRILRASLVQTDTEMAEKYANQRYAVSSHWKIWRTMCVSINGPGDLDLWPWKWCASRIKGVDLHSKFRHARPSGSRVIRYVRDGRTDKSNAYCPLPYGRGITRYLATANRSRSALYNSPASRITEINADISRPTVETDSIQYTGCFKKVAPLKLFRIFSLRFSLFAWNFAHLLAIHIHIYLPIFVDLS